MIRWVKTKSRADIEKYWMVDENDMVIGFTESSIDKGLAMYQQINPRPLTEKDQAA